MQAIILAAGMGKRLEDLTSEHTKCMLKVGSETLIEMALNHLFEIGIKKVILVIGYKGEKLKKFLGHTYKGINLIYVENDIYYKTNNIYSLFLAKDYLVADDTLLLESDLIFDLDALKCLTLNPFPNLVLVSKYESWMDGTVVEIGKNFEIKSFISKEDFEFEKISCYFKTVNIYKFSKEFSRKYYVPFLEAYVKSSGFNEYYEQVLSIISFLDKEKLKVHVLPKNIRWYEIDDKEDLNNAISIFSSGPNRLRILQKRYGGFWRFPQLLDFCYLVNPYFPTKRMIFEFKAQFESLLREYPSGSEIQRLNAAKIFSCPDRNIVVGNGAAEIIKVLFKLLKGNIGIIYPTFNEYPENIEERRIVPFFPKNRNFSYTVDELKDFSSQIDVLVLINPDNPSGHFLTKEEILDLIDFFSREDKKIIVDESFVDFSEYGKINSLIDKRIFLSRPNLIIIKSISKSFGIPGARLGVLVSSDLDIVNEVQKELSIWNINSFGEFFLQIMGKYDKEYNYSCEMIGAQRKKLYQKLEDISYLKPIPSQANYILCEVINQFSSTLLAENLLASNILIKDLTGKKGVNGEYIRIAVRDEEDNNKLLQALRSLDVANIGN